MISETFNRLRWENLKTKSKICYTTNLALAMRVLGFKLICGINFALRHIKIKYLLFAKAAIQFSLFTTLIYVLYIIAYNV